MDQARRSLAASKEGVRTALRSVRESDIVQRVGQPLERAVDVAKSELTRVKDIAQRVAVTEIQRAKDVTQRVEAKLESTLREKFGGFDSSGTAGEKRRRAFQRYKALFGLLDTTGRYCCYV